MSIYLDYAAATPLDERVFAAMMPYFQDEFYNPSSSYLAAKQVRQAIEQARTRVAHWLGAKAAEVIFTAGATESINIAIHGVMRCSPGAKVLFSAIEHDAVRLSAQRYKWGTVPVLSTGTVAIDRLREAIDDTTVLISIGYANNEIGTIQSLSAIAELTAQVRIERQKRHIVLPLYLHTDASQAAGYLDLHASRLGVDLMTLNGGKIYGPKQSGILFIKTGTRLDSFMTGGGQEGGVRGGTENVAAIVGFAAALDLVQQDRKETIAKQTALRDELQRRLLTRVPGTVINGNQKKRLPNNLHISWPDIDGERLVMLLDELGILVATGSACAANKQTVSQVLLAIGLDEAHRQGSLRMSLGSSTTLADISTAAEVIGRTVKTMQSS